MFRLEKGKTKWPDPNVLRELAALYDQRYEDLVRVVASHACGVRSIGDVTSEAAIDTPEGTKDFVGVPLMDGRIAAGPPLVIRDLEVLDYLAFPPTLLDQLGVRPSASKCVRVGPREMSMFATIKPNDIVLLDCSDAKRDHPTPNRIYAVNVEDGSTLKRITLGTDGLSLHSDNLDKGTYPMRTIAFDDEALMRNIIVGEAV